MQDVSLPSRMQVCQSSLSSAVCENKFYVTEMSHVFGLSCVLCHFTWKFKITVSYSKRLLGKVSSLM